MNKFLKKLVQNDTKLISYSDPQQIIKQGMAPIVAINNHSTEIQKANLLEQSKYLNWQEKAAELFSQLQQKEIPFLVFKGFSYSFLLYDNSHIRPYSDIDMIVDEAHYSHAEEILIQLGYTRFSSRQGKFISYQNSFYDNKIPQTIIDLHWQINNRLEIHPYFQFESLYSAGIDIKFCNSYFKSLNSIDAFILACFHYQGHRPDDRKHIWLYDLGLLWHSMDSPTKTNCIKIAKQKQQSAIVNALLVQLNQTFPQCFEIPKFNETNPESSQQYLDERNRKFSDIKIRFKSIKGFKNKSRFLSEYVFQSKSYVQNRYHTSSNILVYFYYPRMWIEDLIKLIKH